MKKIKYLFCILCAALIVLCCSCSLFGPQEYVCDIDTVKAIQIVTLDKYSEETDKFDYTVLAEISDTEAFVEKLNGLKHSVNGGEPGVLQEQYTVIRIEYLNGNSDLIYPNAQYFYRGDKRNYGYFFFNSEEFDTLLAEYVE